jgi:cytochrome c oxidase subunit 3
MSAPEHRDYTGAKLGMWLFLFTELILFGGLFILYAVYLHRYPHEFAAAAQELSLGLGAANTVILLTGSLLVALAVSAVRRGGRRTTQLLLWGGVLSGIPTRRSSTRSRQGRSSSSDSTTSPSACTACTC